MEQLIFFSTLAISSVIAWHRGGAPERVAAVLFILAAFASTLIVRGPHMFAEVEWGLFTVDFLLFAALVALALISDRYWPMWLASFQLVSVCMHPAFGLTTSKKAFAYAIASIIWSYPMLLILVLGAVRHQRRTDVSMRAAQA
jgi:hypothetical protein